MELVAGNSKTKYRRMVGAKPESQLPKHLRDLTPTQRSTVTLPEKDVESIIPCAKATRMQFLYAFTKEGTIRTSFQHLVLSKNQDGTDKFAEMIRASNIRSYQRDSSYRAHQELLNSKGKIFHLPC